MRRAIIIAALTVAILLALIQFVPPLLFG